MGQKLARGYGIGAETVIIVDRPPNFEQIKAAFPDAEKPGVMFAFDGKIYNPSGNVIPPALIAHEEVHLKRQRDLGPNPHSTTKWSGPDLWWDNYLHDSEFRYNEELLAHVAEFQMQRTRDRNFVARLMVHTALRLIAPLYNYVPPRSLQEAMRDLRREIGK
jgi:hypothetical protein